LWEKSGGNRILNHEKNEKKQRKTRKRTKNTKIFDEKIPKSGMQIVVGAGSHARPIRRSLKTERNGIKFLERQYFRRQHGTTKDNKRQHFSQK
jgi:hypothetical protein